MRGRAAGSLRLPGSCFAAGGVWRGGFGAAVTGSVAIASVLRVLLARRLKCPLALPFTFALRLKAASRR